MKRNPFAKNRYELRRLLIFARKNKKISQNILAKKLQKPQSFVSKYENGERILDVVEVYEICKLMDVDFLEMMAEFDSKVSIA